MMPHGDYYILQQKYVLKATNYLKTFHFQTNANQSLSQIFLITNFTILRSSH